MSDALFWFREICQDYRIRLMALPNEKHPSEYSDTREENGDENVHWVPPCWAHKASREQGPYHYEAESPYTVKIEFNLLFLLKF